MWGGLGSKLGFFLCLLVLLDSVKPVLGQFEVGWDPNQIFVFVLVLHESGKPILVDFRVV